MARLNIVVEAGTSAAMSYFNWAAKRGDSAEAAMLAWGDELLVYFRSASPTASAALEEYGIASSLLRAADRRNASAPRARSPRVP